MKYFAYGSNMCSRWLRNRVESARFHAVARLQKHALRFHKTSKDGSGKCDVAATGYDGDVVHGVVFEIDPVEKPALDRCEGLNHGYAEKTVTVDCDGGGISAFTYVAQPTHVDSSLRPYSWYKDLVVAGAREHQLPENYIQSIESVPANADLDSSRDAKNRQFLPCSGGAA